MIAQVATNGALDPLLWAKRPQSQNAIDAVFGEAKHNPTMAGIRDKLIADGVCTEAGQAEYVWSFAADGFVRPPWYVRANADRAAA